MSAVLSVQRFGNPAGQPAIFSKMEMQLSPFLDATFWNYCLQKTLTTGAYFYWLRKLRTAALESDG